MGKNRFPLLTLALILFLAADSCTKPRHQIPAPKPTTTPTDPPGGGSEGGGESDGEAFGDFTGKTLRLCTYNIESPSEKNEAHVGFWPNRVDGCTALIEEYDFDMLGTQEASKSMLQDITMALTQYAWIGCDRTTTSSVNAILYRKSRFDLLDSGHFYYSPTPDVDYTFDPDDKEKKDLNCIWGKFLDKESGITFFLFNTHFHAHSSTVMRDTLRCRDARLLKERIRSVAGDAYVLCTGDFNAREETTTHATGNVTRPSPGYVELTKDGLLLDTRYLAEERENDRESTIVGFLKTGPSANDGKLDHIFLSAQAAGGYRVLFYKVITNSYEMYHHGSQEASGYKPGDKFTANCSDHRPVMVLVDFREPLTP